MKSPKIMVAVLAVSALGLGSIGVATAQQAETEGNNRKASKSTDVVRQNREERRSARRENRQDSDIGAEDDNRADTRRAERKRPRAERRNGEDPGPEYRRGEGRQTGDRQARRDRRQARTERNDTARNARWRDQRSNRDFNRREFGRDQGQRHSAFDRRVDRRLDNQRARTRSGLKSGELTQRELKRIRRDRHKIARMDQRFSSDGRYSKRERRRLNGALDNASRRVYRAKHNRRVATESRHRKQRW